MVYNITYLPTYRLVFFFSELVIYGMGWLNPCSNPPAPYPIIYPDLEQAIVQEGFQVEPISNILSIIISFTFVL